jgi:hypothetical protein
MAGPEGTPEGVRPTQATQSTSLLSRAPHSSSVWDPDALGNGGSDGRTNVILDSIAVDGIRAANVAHSAAGSNPYPSSAYARVPELTICIPFAAAISPAAGSHYWHPHAAERMSTPKSSRFPSRHLAPAGPCGPPSNTAPRCARRNASSAAASRRFPRPTGA